MLLLQKQIAAVAVLNHLFDSNADSDRIDGSLNENFLLFIAANDQRLKQQLFTAPVTTTSTHWE